MPVIKANNININYKVAGQVAPLLMIMGLSADQRGWYRQVPLFQKHFKVITFDNRGVGKSDKPQGPYSIRMLAEDTIGLMDSLGIDKAHILGTSMGGMIAQEIAINYPQRVMKLVLASTYACHDHNSSGPTTELVREAESHSRKIGIELINLAYNQRLNRFFTVLQVKIRSKFTGPLEKNSNKTGFKGQMEACMKHNTLARLPLIQSHTLVITGTKDRVIKSSSSEILARSISNAKLVRVENGSHLLNIEMSNNFNKEVLNFLKNDS